MKKWKLIAVVCAAMFVKAVNLLAIDEEPLGPGKLRSLVLVSDVIAIVAFEGKESNPNPDKLYYGRLRFRLKKTLQGTAKVETVLIHALPMSINYNALNEAKQVLLFLKADKDDSLVLTGPQSYIVLEGDNVGFAEEFQEYLDISRDFGKSEERRRAFRAFMIKKVATSKSEYFRQSMAEELWSMVNGVPLHGFTAEDVVTIAKTTIVEKSFLVAEPMCLVLDKLGSDKTDDCIFHALIESSVGRTSIPLADVIAKREQLVQRLLTKAESIRDVRDSNRLIFILSNLYKVPKTKLLPALNILSQMTSNAKIKNGQNGEEKTEKETKDDDTGKSKVKSFEPGKVVQQDSTKENTGKTKGVAAQGTVNADSPVKSAGNEENHEVQEGKEGK